MARPGGDWPGFSHLSPESKKYKRIQLILSSANFEYLKKRAIDLWRRQQRNLPPDLENHVYWIARIPRRPIDEDTKTSLLSEIATMNIIRKYQPFRYPYVLMECLAGRTLDNGLALSIPPQHHTKVAKQLAKVFVQLQYLTFNRIGRVWCAEAADQPVEVIGMAWHYSPGPLDNSLEYFHYERQGENQETLAMHPNDPDWLTACWVLKTSLAQIIIGDKVRGPFPLCHLDLHNGNLLFDNEFNLTEVMDWSNAQAAPIEQLSVCPEFVNFPGSSEEMNRPIVEFKSLVIRFIKELEIDKVKTPPPDHLNLRTKQSSDLAPLSTYMSPRSAEITHRQYMASSWTSLWTAKLVATLIYGNRIT